MPSPPTAAVPTTLRWAGAADHAQVVRLLTALLDELDLGMSPEGRGMRARIDADVGQIWAGRSARVLLAEGPGGDVIGLGRADLLAGDPLFRLRTPSRCGYVDQMFVVRGWRGRGVGRRLLAALETWLGEAGVSHVLLHAAPGAVEFYRPAGYQLQRQMIKKLP